MEKTSEYWIAALSLKPKLNSIADQLVDRYAKKYHTMLYAAAGFIGANGWLSPVVRCEVRTPIDDIEAILILIIQDLQDAGIIPVATWYKPVAWYVLHFIVIPFVRSVLTQSHYPVT